MKKKTQHKIKHKVQDIVLPLKDALQTPRLQVCQVLDKLFFLQENSKGNLLEVAHLNFALPCTAALMVPCLCETQPLLLQNSH